MGISLTLTTLALLWPSSPQSGKHDQSDVARAEAPTDGLEGSVVLRQIPVARPFHDEAALPPGSRLVILNLAGPHTTLRPLTEGFAAVGRPDLSFDGKRVLFVGQRTRNGPYSVWEMPIDGTDARRIVRCDSPCDQAVYLSTLFDRDTERPVYRIAFRAPPGDGWGHALYTCQTDGSALRRITFTPQSVTDPLPLSNSRIVYSLQRQPTPDSSADPTSRFSGLMSVNTDGTDVLRFAGVDGEAITWNMPCETQDGWIVYVETADVDGPDGERDGGVLAAVKSTRSLHSRRVIAHDPSGFYRSPSPLPNGHLLVSFRLREGGSYGVYTLDPGTGRRGRKIYDDPAWDDVEPLLVRPRREPAGRSSVVDPRSNRGQLYILNAYLSDQPQATAIAPGEIRWLRVMGAVSPGPDGRSSDGRAEVRLGEVRAESDGSFFLDVPAETPLRLETLDADGTVLQSMRSWIWVMPGERRGCIGCHEDRELTPPNRHVLALRKPPVRIGGKPLRGGKPLYDRKAVLPPQAVLPRFKTDNPRHQESPRQR